MEFRILGPLEVVDADRPLALGGERQRALLALLLTRANEVVSTDRLIDGSGGCALKQALNTIQYYISQLRKTLGADRIVARPARSGRATGSTSPGSSSSGTEVPVATRCRNLARARLPTSRTSRSRETRRAGSGSACRPGRRSTPTSKAVGPPSSSPSSSG
jgi:hypothetical protein